MKLTKPPLTVSNCRCGSKPVTAWGQKDNQWFIMITCREPEKHEILNELYCVITNHLHLHKAIAEAEDMWRSLQESHPAKPTVKSS